MNSNNELIDMLTIVALLLLIVIAVLICVYWLISKKNKNSDSQKADIKPNNKENYTKLSVFNFMEFDKIEDNMIIQDNGKRFLMVVECQGVNYDLMSEVEKTGVEAGFVQFLNTLRHPIQIYTQTRTIKIESSIENYKKRLKEIKKELDKKEKEYKLVRQSEKYTQKQLQDTKLEYLRMQNMYDYTLDVINNIEQISQNKNVLRKHYYIVVPYYASEIESDLLTEEEKRNMIFSELYTRAQSVIRTLFACSMKCKILDSEELTELLYVAYNRDDSEIFGIEKAMNSGYDELYSTAKDVIDKRIEALDREIEQKAIKLAEDAIETVKTEKQLKLMKKEKTFDELIEEMAEVLLKQNKRYIGEEITEEAITKIKKEKTKEKEENVDAKKTEKRKRVTRKTN